MPGLSGGEIAKGLRFCMNRQDTANAERQGGDTVAHCAKHKESLKKTEQKINRA